MKYYDLSSCEKRAAAALGYAPAPAATSVVLRSRKDIPTQPGFFAVQSENPDLLVEACKRGTATLVMPLDARDYWRNNALLQAAIDKNRVFEIPLRPLLHAHFVQRAKLLNQTRFFLKRCVKRGVAFVITSRAENEYDLKSPREAIAIAQLLGLNFQQAQYALSKQCEKVIEELAEKGRTT